MAGRRALVIGGGIGGLAAGIALRRVGWEVRIHERAPRIEARGSGLAIQPNAMLALRHLGLEAPVRAAGHEIRRTDFLDPEGRVLKRVPVGPLADAVGAPALTIDRGTLQRILLDAAGSAVRPGKELVDLDQIPGGVLALFADGTEERGDLLVGADGLRSAVRTALYGPEALRAAGYVAWRGLALAAPLWPAGASAEIWGRGLRFGIARVDERTIYWFAVQNLPPGGRDPEAGAKPGLLERFGEWCAPVPALLAATPEEGILRNDILDRPPRPAPWGRGRVTLLGDAAHPMTPNLGQGACQALEDAVVLARRVEGAADPGEGLRAYEAQRAPRTSAFVTRSHRAGAVGGWASPTACALRDCALRAVPGPMVGVGIRNAWRFQP